MNQKGIALILIVILIAAVLLGGYLIYQSQTKSNQIACTQDAKICPDGSAVGRVGPNCEFTPCPTPSSTPQPSPSQSPCPPPPQCPGRIVYGDPSPTDPNQCPRYQCL